MLREVKHSQLGARILTFSASESGGTATNIHGNDEITFSSSGNGFLTSTFLRPFHRAPVFGCSWSSADITAGSYCFGSGAFTATAGIIATAKNGVADAGTKAGVIFGWDSPDTTVYKKNQCLIETGRKNSRVVGCQINTATPTVNLGKNSVSVVKNGTGDVTVTFLQPFGNDKIVPIPCITGSTARAVDYTSLTASSVRIKITQVNSSTAADGTFNLLVFGNDAGTGTYTGTSMGTLMNNQRNPRMVVGCSTYDGSGVPTLATGVGDGTITDNGAGDLIFAYTNAFAREPIVVAVTGGVTSNTYASIHTSSASQVRLQQFGVTGTLGDPGNGGTIDYIILGSDDADEK